MLEGAEKVLARMHQVMARAAEGPASASAKPEGPAAASAKVEVPSAASDKPAATLQARFWEQQLLAGPGSASGNHDGSATFQELAPLDTPSRKSAAAKAAVSLPDGEKKSTAVSKPVVQKRVAAAVVPAEVRVGSKERRGKAGGEAEATGARTALGTRTALEERIVLEAKTASEPKTTVKGRTEVKRVVPVPPRSATRAVALGATLGVAPATTPTARAGATPPAAQSTPSAETAEHARDEARAAQGSEQAQEAGRAAASPNDEMFFDPPGAPQASDSSVESGGVTEEGQGAYSDEGTGTVVEEANGFGAAPQLPAGYSLVAPSNLNNVGAAQYPGGGNNAMVLSADSMGSIAALQQGQASAPPAVPFQTRQPLVIDTPKGMAAATGGSFRVSLPVGALPGLEGGAAGSAAPVVAAPLQGAAPGGRSVRVQFSVTELKKLLAMKEGAGASADPAMLPDAHSYTTDEGLTWHQDGEPAAASSDAAAPREGRGAQRAAEPAAAGGGDGGGSHAGGQAEASAQVAIAKAGADAFRAARATGGSKGKGGGVHVVAGSVLKSQQGPAPARGEGAGKAAGSRVRPQAVTASKSVVPKSVATPSVVPAPVKASGGLQKASREVRGGAAAGTGAKDVAEALSLLGGGK